MDRANDIIQALFGGVIVESGETAYSVQQIESIMQLIVDKSWIILGGDMYWCNGKVAYANWFYNPVSSKPLPYNTINSVIKCREFIREMELVAPGSLYVLVVSDQWILGR